MVTQHDTHEHIAPLIQLVRHRLAGGQSPAEVMEELTGHGYDSGTIHLCLAAAQIMNDDWEEWMKANS